MTNAAVQWSQMVIDLVGELAWPSVVVGVLITFRKEIRRALAHVRKASALGVSLELAEYAEEAERQTRAFAETPVVSTVESSLEGYFQKVLDDGAVGRFLVAWKKFELAVFERADQLDVPGRHGARNISAAMQFLESQGEIDHSTYDAYRALQHLRNALVHDGAADMTARTLAEAELATSRLTRAISAR